MNALSSSATRRLRLRHLPRFWLALACAAGIAALAARPASAPAEPATLPGETDPASPVKALYAAFDSGHIEQARALIAPDATWTFYGPSELLPFAGVRHGPEGMLDFFARVDATLADSQQVSRQFIVQGDMVAVPGYEESTVKSTGVRYHAANVHVWRVRAGKIVSFEEFIDSGTILEAFTPADPARGKALFTTCAGCHGNQAQGRSEMFAPPLAGQTTAYLRSQLANFRQGRRGKVADMHGFQMVGRATALPGERAIRDVTAWIARQPAPLPLAASAPLRPVPRPLAGLVQQCAACHDAQGQGKAATGAPVLTILSAPYIARQLENYRAGLRGYAADDAAGAQMAAVAKSIENNQQVLALARYFGK